MIGLPLIVRLAMAGAFAAISLSSWGQTSTGSGFFVSDRGYLITNHHVVGDASVIKVRTVDGKIYDARVVKADPEIDLALLKVEGGPFAAQSIANSGAIRRGESVFALGFPQIQIQGLEPKITEGIISSLSGLADDPRNFQISNPIQPGNSGGPLVSEDGKVVGVVVATLSASYMQRTFGTVPQNVNYAIKSSHILSFLASAGITPSQTTSPTRRRTDMLAQVEKSLVLVVASADEPSVALSKRSAFEQKKIVDDNPYPERPVTLIVPYAKGGPTDMLARGVAEALSRALGAQFVVQNALGENGTIGTKQALDALADGYTLLYQNISLVTAPILSTVGSKPLFEDLAPIGMTVEVPMVVVADGRTKIADLASLVDYKRARSAVKIAYSGEGTPSHLCALAIDRIALGGGSGLVGYRGSGPALTALLEGKNEIMCDQAVMFIAHLQSQQIKGVAVASSQRLSQLIQVPTMVEQGSEIIASNWNGLFAQKGTPAAVLLKLSRGLQLALLDPGVRAQMQSFGVIPASTDQATPEFMTGLVKKDYRRYKALLGR